MSTADVSTIPTHLPTEALRAQLAELGGEAPTRLLLTCSESEPGAPPGWRRELGPALQLASPAAAVDLPGLRDALRYAVGHLGVREVVLVLHSHCAHLPDGVAREGGPGRPFMQRLRDAQAARQRRLGEARSRVRAAVLELASDPALAAAEPVGLVHLDESGVLLAYDPNRDDFQALL